VPSDDSKRNKETNFAQPSVPRSVVGHDRRGCRDSGALDLALSLASVERAQRTYRLVSRFFSVFER